MVVLEKSLRRAGSAVGRLGRLGFILLAGMGTRCGQTTISLFPAEAGSAGSEQGVEDGGKGGSSAPAEAGQAAGSAVSGVSGGGAGVATGGSGGRGFAGEPSGGNAGLGGNDEGGSGGTGGSVSNFCSNLKACTAATCPSCDTPVVGCNRCDENGFCSCTEDSCPEGMICDPVWHRCVSSCESRFDCGGFKPWCAEVDCTEEAGRRKRACLDCDNTACQAPQYCWFGRCIECSTSAQCQFTGTVCLDGRCGCRSATDCLPSPNPAHAAKCVNGLCAYSPP